MKAVDWRPQAEADAADAAWHYAMRGGLAVGDRFLQAVEATLSHIAGFPEIGSTRHAAVMPESPLPLRFFPVRGFERYLVYYLDAPDRIDVVRIWHAARGLDELTVDVEHSARGSG